VRDGLLAHAASRGAKLLPETLVTDFFPSGAGWRVARADGPPLDADAVVVATGGLSVPATGSDGLGHRVLERLGHAMNTTYPALTPLTSDSAAFAALSGLSLRVTLTAQSALRSATARGGFLFTHRGYSGPAVLDVSHVAVRAQSEPHAPARIIVQWAALDEPAWDLALRAEGTRTVIGALRAELPDRLAAALVQTVGVDPLRTLSELPREQRLRLVDILVRGSLPVTGDEGFRKAEVTGGGVSLAEVEPGTLESRRHRGLHLCGEVLDAFGPIGGYNFLWAWATGRAAGIGAASVQPSAA
jgi:hypothetical protein